jgi:hypothetical protein
MRQPAPLHDSGDAPEKGTAQPPGSLEEGSQEDEHALSWFDILCLATFVFSICAGVGLLTKVLI